MNLQINFSLNNFKLSQQVAKCRLARCTGKTWVELRDLKYSLGIRYSDMLIFYNELGFLPSPGFSISIRHFGIEAVIESIRNNLIAKTNLNEVQ